MGIPLSDTTGNIPSGKAIAAGPISSLCLRLDPSRSHRRETLEGGSSPGGAPLVPPPVATVKVSLGCLDLDTGKTSDTQDLGDPPTLSKECTGVYGSSVRDPRVECRVWTCVCTSGTCEHGRTDVCVHTYTAYVVPRCVHVWVYEFGKREGPGVRDGGRSDVSPTVFPGSSGPPLYPVPR